MTKLITLSAAREHLHIIHDADDTDLERKILAASALVLRYLKKSGIADFVDSSGNLEFDSDGVVQNVPYDVQAATLLMVGYLYEQRDHDERHEFEMGYLPRPVMALLYSRRDPACA